jgi:hypothetical protein
MTKRDMASIERFALVGIWREVGRYHLSHGAKATKSLLPVTVQNFTLISPPNVRASLKKPKAPSTEGVDL